MDVKNNGVSAAMKYKDDAEVRSGILKNNGRLQRCVTETTPIAAASGVEAVVRAGSRASPTTTRS